jgi:hypothetical protein
MLGDMYSNKMTVALHRNVQSPYRTMAYKQTQHGQLREEPFDDRFRDIQGKICLLESLASRIDIQLETYPNLKRNGQ